MQKILIIASLFFVLAFNAKAQETFNGYKEIVAAAKSEIKQISVEDFHKKYTNALINGRTNFTLIDIRTEAEYDEGFIPGAFLVQRGILESCIEKDAVWEAFNHAKPNKTDTIILYCHSGSRSALAAKTLKMLGYSNVFSLEGGWKGWSEEYPKLKKTN